MAEGILKLGEGQWGIKDGNLLLDKEVAGNHLKREFTVTRGTRATYVGRDGLIKESNLQDVNLVNNGDFSELGIELITNGSFDTDSDWTKDTGWSIANGVASQDGTGSGNDGDIIQDLNFDTNKIYKLVLTVTNYTQGTLYIDTTNINLNITSNGTYTLYFTPSSSFLYIRTRYSGFIGSIDNVSVKEVDPNDYWNLGTGWSIEDGKLKSDGTINVLAIQENVFSQSGSTYKITLDVNVVSGSLSTRVTMGDSVHGYTTISNITSEGSYTLYATAVANQDNLNFTTLSDNTAVYTIDNVSVQEVKTDTPRIDFTDNTDGHLLLEPQSTNLVTYSEDFSEWTKTGGTTVSATNILSPSGENNGTNISGLSGSGENDLYLITGQDPASKTYSASVYLKGNGTLRLQISNNVNQGIGEIITLTSDWKRHTVTGTFNSTSGNLSVTLDDNGGTATEYKVWGAQMEQLSYATSYIPTNGSTVTRDAETCTGAGEAQDFNSEEGVLYAEIAALDDSTTTTIFSLSNGTNANTLYMGFSSTSNTIQAQLVVGNVAQTNMNYVVTDRTQFNKVAVLYQNNNHKMYINGSEVAVDTSGSVPSANTFDRLNFDFGQGSFDFYGKCKAIRVYKKALSDSELKTLTS